MQAINDVSSRARARLESLARSLAALNRYQAAAAALALLVLCAGCIMAFRARVPGRVEILDAGASAPAPERRELTVHVAGAVARPGLYRLPEGSRVADALDGAGGPAAGALLDNLNLAARLKDGEKVMVPGPQPDARQDAGAGPRSAADPRVNINTAGRDELEGLPGVGPSLADRIVRHREKNGAFSSVDELDDVEGIGPRKLESLRELVMI